MTRPFEGVKILDFTQVLAGPYASYQLALLGADVIKIERREAAGATSLLPLWEKVAREARRMRGSCEPRDTPHPSPHFVRRHPLPRGERERTRRTPI